MCRTNERKNLQPREFGSQSQSKLKREGSEFAKELETWKIKPESFQTPSDLPMRGAHKSAIKKVVSVALTTKEKTTEGEKSKQVVQKTEISTTPSSGRSQKLPPIPFLLTQ